MPVLPVFLIGFLIIGCNGAATETVSPDAGGPTSDVRARIEQAQQDASERPDDLEAQIELARALYLGGVQQPDEPWLDEAIDAWDRLLDQDEQNPIILAYTGSVRMIQSRQASLPWVKGSYLEQGRELLNEAVESAPEDMQVRWLRAVTAYRLPATFGARDQAQADFAHLTQRLGELDAADRPGHDPTANLEPAMIASTWYHHGLFQKEDGQMQAALQAWQRATEAAPQSTAGQDAADAISAHSAN